MCVGGDGKKNRYVTKCTWPLQLLALGFRQMDALDPSEGMLSKAREKGIYSRLFNEAIGDTRLPIDDGEAAIAACDSRK